MPWSEAAGLIILGGTISANDGDRFPFLLAELDWIREAIQRDVPLLGICLGAQLMANALGSAVYRSPRKEIGWYEVELLPAAAEDRLFRDRSARETVFHWHGDTFDMPAGAVHLARSPLCPQQAFRYGPLAYGLQFHVEMVPELMDLWLREFDAGGDSGDAGLVDPESIRAAAAGAFPALRSFSRCLLGRFAALCRDDGANQS